MKKIYPKNLLIIISITSAVIVGLRTNCSYALTPDKTSAFNMRVTRESLLDYGDSLIILDEKQKLKLDSLFFQDVNLLTGDFAYNEILSAKNQKFSHNAIQAVMKSKNEEEINSLIEQDSIYNINLSKQRNNNTNVSFYSGINQPENHMYSMIDPKTPASVDSTTEKAYNKALEQYKNGYHDEAEKLFNDVLKAKPDFAFAYYNLGNIYYKKGDYYKALDNFNKAMDLNPSYADVYYNIAVTLENVEQKTLARKFYKKCIELNPSDSDARTALGRLD